jgi:hypothetical protein
MSTKRDTPTVVRDWLVARSGQRPDPSPLLDAVFAQLPVTPQRHRRWARSWFAEVAAGARTTFVPRGVTWLVVGGFVVTALVVGLIATGAAPRPRLPLNVIAPTIDHDPTAQPSASPSAVVSPSPQPSSGATATARLESLCDLLSVDEVEKATQTPWEIVAVAGHYLDRDPNCRYLATGNAPLTPDGEPITVVAIEELEAPSMVRYWDGSFGVDVPVNGAKARWVKGEDTLVIAKGERIFTIRFLTEQAQVAGHDTPPPPAGGFEAAAMGILQIVVDRLP